MIANLNNRIARKQDELFQLLNSLKKRKIAFAQFIANLELLLLSLMQDDPNLDNDSLAESVDTSLLFKKILEVYCHHRHAESFAEIIQICRHCSLTIPNFFTDISVIFNPLLDAVDDDKFSADDAKTIIQACQGISGFQIKALSLESLNGHIIEPNPIQKICFRKSNQREDQMWLVFLSEIITNFAYGLCYQPKVDYCSNDESIFPLYQVVIDQKWSLFNFLLRKLLAYKKCESLSEEMKKMLGSCLLNFCWFVGAEQQWQQLPSLQLLLTLEASDDWTYENDGFNPYHCLAHQQANVLASFMQTWKLYQGQFVNYRLLIGLSSDQNLKSVVLNHATPVGSVRQTVLDISTPDMKSALTKRNYWFECFVQYQNWSKEACEILTESEIGKLILSRVAAFTVDEILKHPPAVCLSFILTIIKSESFFLLSHFAAIELDRLLVTAVKREILADAIEYFNSEISLLMQYLPESKLKDDKQLNRAYQFLKLKVKALYCYQRGHHYCIEKLQQFKNDQELMCLITDLLLRRDKLPPIESLGLFQENCRTMLKAIDDRDFVENRLLLLAQVPLLVLNDFCEQPPLLAKRPRQEISHLKNLWLDFVSTSAETAERDKLIELLVDSIFSIPTSAYHRISWLSKPTKDRGRLGQLWKLHSSNNQPMAQIPIGVYQVKHSEQMVPF